MPLTPLLAVLLCSWHLDLAKELVHTCYQMYNTTITGLSPEIAHFNMNPDVGHDIEIHSRDTHNILRPETVESLFYLYRATGNRVYQEWGWQIFSAFEKHSKIESGGYSGLQNVQVGLTQRDTAHHIDCSSYLVSEFVLLLCVYGYKLICPLGSAVCLCRT